MIYKRDIIDGILDYINERNIIVLLGARQVGKTSINYFLRKYSIEDYKVVGLEGEKNKLNFVYPRRICNKNPEI